MKDGEERRQTSHRRAERQRGPDEGVRKVLKCRNKNTSGDVGCNGDAGEEDEKRGEGKERNA